MERPLSAVKTINAEEGRVGGYLVVWGDANTRDLQGEYFTQKTDFALDWYEARPMLYHHGLDGDLKAAVIGHIEHLRLDEIGIWAEAQLDLRQRYIRAVQRLVDKGILHWSSGSLAHLVEVDGNGEIKRWPLVEGSLTPTPAEPRLTDVQTIKSAYEMLGLDFPHPPFPSPILKEGESNLGNLTDSQGREKISPYAVGGDLERGNNETENEMKGNFPMQEQTIGRKQLPVASQNDARNQIVVSSEFDTMEALDMLYGYMLLRAGKSFQGVSERYANALSYKVQKAGLNAIKADELAYSTQTGFGDEWVPELWSAQIWQKARNDNTILPLFRSIEMIQTLKL
jgi:hypothetical protein